MPIMAENESLSGRRGIGKRLFPLLIAFVLGACVLGSQRSEPGGPLDRETWQLATSKWSQLSPGSIPQQLPRAEAQLGALFEAPFSAASCARHRDGLQASLQRMPVDLYKWYSALDCAELLDDRQWQAQSEQAIDALIRYALRDGRARTPWQPAPILHPMDVYPLVAALEMDVLWKRYLTFDSVRYLLLEVSAVDDGGRQHRLYFDQLQALTALNSEDWLIAFPGPRRALALSVLESEALAGDPLALAGFMNTDIEGWSLNAVAARRALERAWQSGYPGPAVSLLEVCLNWRDAACSPELETEALEGLRSLDIAEGWALEAGRLIIRELRSLDDEAVRVALDAAESMTPPGSSLYYVSDLLREDESLGQRTDAARHREVRLALLQRAAERGEPRAHLQLALIDAEGGLSGQVSADQRIRLAADAGLPMALHLSALKAGLASDRGLALMRRSAELGLAESQFVLGALTGRLLDTEESSHWLHEAAMGGHYMAIRIKAMRALAEETEDGKRLALDWLSSGMMLGDVSAVALLAAVYVAYPDLNPDDPDRGFAVIDALWADEGADTALLVARQLFEIAPFSRQPALAQAVLEHLAASGLAEAGLQLGERFMRGDGLDRDQAAGEAWFRRAHELGNEDALYELGMALIYDLDDLESGLAVWDEAAGAGSDWAGNDLAFVLCTGELGASRDPDRGMAVISRILERRNEPHHYMLSTLAACQAAHGDFEQARINHAQALAETERLDPDAEQTLADMRQRMALYEAGRPYIADAAR